MLHAQAEKSQENNSSIVENKNPKRKIGSETQLQFATYSSNSLSSLQAKANASNVVQRFSQFKTKANNSPQVKRMFAFQAMADNFTLQQAPVQRKKNNTGLPDNLKSGIESLSGYSLDDVNVHYNSNQPAQLNAHAYAQGSDIHLASGQEKHLPHEAWHVVQQKQGRVKPTLQMKGKVNVNDDESLEKEADVMGQKATQMKSFAETPSQNPINTSGTQVVQRLKGADGTAEEGKDVPFTIDQEFIDKHVANDAGEAVTVTEDRIKTGKPPGIVAGTSPNNLAKKADWEAAIKDSEDVVPPEGEWFETDESQFVNALTKVEVDGWEAQGTAGNVVAKDTVNKKFLGGTWKVSDCKYDDDEEYEDGSGKAEMEISHLTS